MLFELRQYKIEPGHRDAFVELMERKIIPFQVQQGMVILGSFVAKKTTTRTSGFAASAPRKSASSSTTPSITATTGATKSRPPSVR